LGVGIALVTITLPSASNRANSDSSGIGKCKKAQVPRRSGLRPPPVSRRRGFQPPQGRRGTTIEPFTEEERKKLDKAPKNGTLPSADLEVYFDYDKADISPPTRQTLGPLGQALIDPKPG
jgi:hypothetical protein